MEDLKEKTIRGEAVCLGSQVAGLALRTGALVVLARLLGPKDFGLVGMVTVFTGVLSYLRNFGLATAAVQRSDITSEQRSTLVWLNVLLGALLALITLAGAPAIAAFYHEPRLLWVAAALGTAFLFNAVGIQHCALLQRQMRFIPWRSAWCHWRSALRSPSAEPHSATDSFVLGLTLPIMIAFALFADDIVVVLLGPEWQSTTGIARLLAPTITVTIVTNPMGWLIYSLAIARRGLKIALVFAPIMILGCVLGLPYGASRVAFAYSTVMVLWVVPRVAWCVNGTAISFRDVAAAVIPALACGAVAGAMGYAARLVCGDFLSPLPRLVVESGGLAATFFALQVFVAGQKALYVDLLRE